MPDCGQVVRSHLGASCGRDVEEEKGDASLHSCSTAVWRCPLHVKKGKEESEKKGSQAGLGLRLLL